MNPIEQLRWVAEAEWRSPSELVSASIELMFEMAWDRSALLAGVKRLLQMQPTAVELWSIANAIVGSMDLAEDLSIVGEAFFDHIEYCDLHQGRVRTRGGASRRIQRMVPCAISEDFVLVEGSSESAFLGSELTCCGWMALPEGVAHQLQRVASTAAVELLRVDLAVLGGIVLDGAQQSGPFDFGPSAPELLAPFPARLGGTRARYLS